MALLAEEIVEEWLNRQGYFTIRGIKLSVHEVDLLAIKRQSDGSVKCRHIEVQASMRPVSFISKVPKKLQKTGRAANSTLRSDSELVEGVAEWIHTKFQRPEKKALMQSLWPGMWSSELVINTVKSQREVELIRGHGVSVLQLKDVVGSLTSRGGIVSSAAGADFIDLIHMGACTQPAVPTDGPAAPLGRQARG